ncbi:MAG: GTP 3',8-cyclase MoaA [Candidatus Marinimicrobia bacterium]|nr:GTP 3',8-cyclase MoaA [Candidatus Neomarinimicrobiota bacterium]MDP7058962.1 GTP 3',8-cyclase MoaA [Candidatus Neomarinimicrobiota bacterium]
METAESAPDPDFSGIDLERDTDLVRSTKTLKHKPVSSALNGNLIIDQFGRTFEYVRIALNERCNLRCVYCMPEEGVDFLPQNDLLTTDEIMRLISVLSENGVSRIRFTGGEPLLHKDIISLVECAVGTGIKSVHMTTNGLMLKKHVKPLFDAGLTGINISLDTLDHQKFVKITRREGLEQVMEGLRLALASPIPSVKMNVVFMRDFNHKEIGEFLELTRDNPLTIRFIELMPFDAHQIWKTGKFFGAEKIEEEVRRIYPDIETDSGTATEHRIFKIPGYAGKVGIIPAFTRSLCGECNRIRVTADGKIRNCLYSDDEFDLKRLIQNGATDMEIGKKIRRAMWMKSKDGWVAQRQGDHGRESMTQIGG